MNMYQNARLGLLVAAVLGGMKEIVSAQVVQSADEAAEFPQATLACKVKMGAITETEIGSMNGALCAARGTVISPLKGELGKHVQIAFRRQGNGPSRPEVDAIKSGGVYIVMLKGSRPPYQVFAAMKAVDGVVEHTLGTKPVDRLMAELVAMWDSNDVTVRLAAVEQIGIMRDARGSAVVNVAAADKDAETARAGLIAQYRLKIAPDAKRLMELFNPKVMDVWYEESGIPQKDAQGKSIWQGEGNLRIWQRGVADFDYATYVREGIKHEWVRKDEHSLYVFFGVPWKVQRKACVPELVKLLEDPDKRVRRWAATCLAHTVENQHVSWESHEFETREEEALTKWRTWWKENGKAYMAEPAAKPK